MIYDKIDNIKKYFGISPYLDEAIAFIDDGKISGLDNGKTEIHGNFVFANVMEAEAKKAEEVSFEIHRRYLDIQIDIEGTECIETGLEPDGEIQPFDGKTDFGTVQCRTSSRCIMGPGRFIFCMPEEPHKPGIAVGSDTHLKKCVIKVALG